MNYYILDGTSPVAEPDILKFGAWFETANRRVAETTIGAARVSTVFLGIDHNFDSAGPPILFETLVFGGELDEEMDRYCTWQQAEEGHEAMCQRVREARNKQVVPN